MICDSHRFSVDVQVKVFAPSKDSESLASALVVALLYRSERPACISNHVLAAISGVCLGKDGSKSHWAGIDAYFGMLIGIKKRQSLGPVQELLKSVFTGCLSGAAHVGAVLGSYTRELI